MRVAEMKAAISLLQGSETSSIEKHRENRDLIAGTTLAIYPRDTALMALPPRALRGVFFWSPSRQPWACDDAGAVSDGGTSSRKSETSSHSSQRESANRRARRSAPSVVSASRAASANRRATASFRSV